MEVLCFKIDDRRFAIPVVDVERILMAQAITDVPESPEPLQGVINFHGQIIAVINLRARLGICGQPVKVTDRFIIARYAGRYIALVVDEMEGVLVLPELDHDRSIETEFGLQVRTMVHDTNGIILIYDLEKLINIDEEIDIEEITKRLEATAS